MAFLIDRGIAAESEEEFDAEGDRYEELKSKLLGGQTMKHEETEELLAAAKSRGDQKTVDALKNVAGDPPAGGAAAEKKILRETDVGKTPGQQLLDALNALDNGEMSTSKVFMAHPASPRRAIDFVVDSFDEGVLTIKWSGRGMQPLAVKDFLEQLREAGVKKISEIARIIDANGDLEISEVGMPNSMRNIFLFMKKIADQTDYKSKFGDLLSEDEIEEKEPTKAELLDRLIKMCEPGSGVRNALEEIKDKFALDESSAYVQGGDLEAASDELWNAIDRLAGRKDLTADECEWDAQAGVLVLTYRGIGWYEGHAATASGPAEGGGFAEEVGDDVESDLAKVRGEFLKSSGFDFEFTHDSVKTAIADAAELVKKDGEDAIGRKENRFGDWDYVADCAVRIPCRLTYGPARIDEAGTRHSAGDVREKEDLLPDRSINRGEFRKEADRAVFSAVAAAEDGMLSAERASYVARPGGLTNAARIDLAYAGERRPGWVAAFEDGREDWRAAAEKDVRADLEKIREVLERESLANFDFWYADEFVEQALSKAEPADGGVVIRVAVVPEFGEDRDPADSRARDDWDPKWDEKPGEGPEFDEFGESTLPDSVVKEAVETFRRMY